MTVELKMVFTGRAHGNVSFKYGSREEVLVNRFTPLKTDRIGFSPHIEHGTKILVITEENLSRFDGMGMLENTDENPIVGDAVIVTATNLPILMAVADCPPIVLHDERKNVFAVVHSGRKGTFSNIIGKTATAMRRDFQSRSKDLIAHVFPGICRACYQLSPPIGKVPRNLKDYALEADNGKVAINLQSMIIRQLTRTGIDRVLFPAGYDACTCHTRNVRVQPLYFSHFGHCLGLPGHEIAGRNGLFVKMMA